MTLSQWQKCLALLNESQVKRLIKSIGFDADPENELDPLVGVNLAIADWVTHLGLFTDAQVYRLLSAIDKQLESFANTLSDARMPVFTIAICDGRWVSCVGRERFFDMQEYEEIDQLPDYCVTHIICDVTQLYAKMKYRVERAAGSKETLDVNNQNSKRVNAHSDSRHDAS